MVIHPTRRYRNPPGSLDGDCLVVSEIGQSEPERPRSFRFDCEYDIDYDHPVHGIPPTGLTIPLHGNWAKAPS
jgi:hypothetical protein